MFGFGWCCWMETRWAFCFVGLEINVVGRDGIIFAISDVKSLGIAVVLTILLM
jgi:hypothetical protein